jgi:ligand-binding sensor domain-containing protein
MIKFLKYSFLLLFFLLPVLTFSQIKNIGVPFIINHSRSTYNASTQNWAITQDQRGFMYFGNNDGVMIFDGTTWRVHPTPNGSVVRSLLAIGDTVYAGSFEEIAYMAPNLSGEMIYHSLTHLIPRQFTNFDEIWNIYNIGKNIYFHSFNYLFIYNNETIRVIEPLSNFGRLHRVNNQLYVVDIDHGLMQVKDDGLLPISNHPVFSRNEITGMLALNNNDLLICTSGEGVFVWDGQKLFPWESLINEALTEYNLFSALKLSDGSFAFGTIRNGVFITDRNGVVLQHLNRYKGLQNNTILTLYEDRRNNLWLGLDNGIDFLEVSSPLTILNYNYNIESSYASILHNGIMYIGTNQGLYALEANKINNSTESKFRLIKGTEGQVWSLEVINNALLCGHNTGCFQVDGFTARKISDIRGFWSFTKMPYNQNIVLAGTYSGLVRLQWVEGRWRFLNEMEGFKESSRNKIFDRNFDLWIAHGYKGIFKIGFSQNFDAISEVVFFGTEAGLPETLPYTIQLINNEIVVSTYSGLHTFDNFTNKFIPNKKLNNIFASKGFIDMLREDSNGNIWYFTPQHMGVMRLLEDGTYRDVSAPFSRINENLLPAFNNIYIASNDNVFIGSQSGLIHYDPTMIKDYTFAEAVFIKSATFYGKTQSRNFYYNSDDLVELPFSLNSVSFRYTIPAYENPSRLRFSYRLKGFDNQWSEWDGMNFKEYTNLREGNYVFEIKAINAFGAQSSIESFSFKIAAPFFRSNLAYAIYSLLLAFIIAGNIIFIKRRARKIKLKELQKHNKKLARKEQAFKEKSAISEKEIVLLKNDKLEREMQFKNKELANATLHLIQKNKTLTSLKNDINQLMKNTSGSEKQMVASNLLKKINKDLRNEKQWELFNNYFDDVHQDFINRLKEKFPDLSPKELRLCAYLRMNISSKEIAPLMNISVRGVEISRYRLRKKLNLEHDINLTEFILTF